MELKLALVGAFLDEDVNRWYVEMDGDTVCHGLQEQPAKHLRDILIRLRAELRRVSDKCRQYVDELADIRAQNNFLHEEHKLVLSSEVGLARDNRAMREQLDYDHAAMVEGAARIEALRKELAAAREALKPFADLRVTRFMTDSLRYNFRVDPAWIRKARTACGMED